MAEQDKQAGIPQGGFEDLEQLAAWLEDQPHEVALAIAWRSAARVFPLLAGEKPDAVILPVLRAIAVSRFAAVWPNHETEKVKSAAYSARSARSADSADSARSAAYSARSAAYSALSADSARSAADSARSAAYSARSAAYSARSAAYSAAVWTQVTNDARLAESQGVKALNEATLWIGASTKSRGQIVPPWVHQKWTEMEQQLSKLLVEQEWMVWLHWYDDILRGKPGPTRNRDIEFARLFGHPDAGVEITEDDWKAEPSVVNPKIRQVLDWFDPQPGSAGEAPNVPPQSPAPIEAAIVDERVVRVDLQPSRMSSDVLATHAILRSETSDLAERCKGQLPDASAALNRCHEALSEALGSTNVFEVGYWADILRAISVRVDESILDDGAGRFAGLIVNLDRFLRQFPEWNEYVSRAAGAEVSHAINSEQASNAAEAVVRQVAAHEEVVDRSVTNPLHALYKAMADGMQYNPETAYGFYRSLSNVIQVVSQMTLDALPEKTRQMLREAVSTGAVDQFLVDCLKAVRSGVIKSTAAIGIAILATASSALLVLAGVMPNIFGWVPAVLRFLGLA